MSDIDDLLGIDAEDPQVALATVLVRADTTLLRELVETRARAGLSQQEVADRLGISQPSVAAFERYDNDPKLSTIRRYALAVGALVTHSVDDAEAHRVASRTAHASAKASGHTVLKMEWIDDTDVGRAGGVRHDETPGVRAYERSF